MMLTLVPICICTIFFLSGCTNITSQKEVDQTLTNEIQITEETKETTISTEIPDNTNEEITTQIDNSL